MAHYSSQFNLLWRRD